jgi:AcrR family transcriptional regulator
MDDEMQDVRTPPADSETKVPVGDPNKNLNESAQQLLEAARKLLLEGGFQALSIDNIVKEAGKNKASVKYYFGNKDGLIIALADSLDHDQCLQLAEETRGSVGQERLRRYADGQTRIASDADAFLMFYDMLPHIVRDERLRPRLARIYEWYYQMNLEWLGLTERVTGENRADFLALGALLCAAIDGLAFQSLLQVKGLDLPRSIRLLERILEVFLDNYVDAIAGAPATEG